MEIFERTFGNISVSCKHMSIARQTFYNWKKADEDFAEKVDDIEQGLMDFAETQLFNAIRNGKTAELIFYLKTKAKRTRIHRTSNRIDRRSTFGF